MPSKHNTINFPHNIRYTTHIPSITELLLFSQQHAVYQITSTLTHEIRKSVYLCAFIEMASHHNKMLSKSIPSDT
jgi:hypothetical protein